MQHCSFYRLDRKPYVSVYFSSFYNVVTNTARTKHIRELILVITYFEIVNYNSIQTKERRFIPKALLSLNLFCRLLLSYKLSQVDT